MLRSLTRNFFLIALVFISVNACAKGDAQQNSATASSSNDAKPASTPSNKFTPADISKLKWIEGTWRGMDGDKPFYERYTFDGTTMIVQGLNEDGSPDGEAGRYELKNGEFGKGEGEKRSAASEITDTYVQFVPGPSAKGNSYRFTKQPHGWDALLEWTATAGRPAGQKTYRMEPWEPKK